MEPQRVIAEVRGALSNNLDTPRALQLLDVWADETLRGLGNTPDAGTEIANCVDALLGIQLDVNS